MKRTLITAAALYLLHRRQKAMEMRLQEQRAAQLVLDGHLANLASEAGERLNQVVAQTNRAFEEVGESLRSIAATARAAEAAQMADATRDEGAQ